MPTIPIRANDMIRMNFLHIMFVSILSMNVWGWATRTNYIHTHIFETISIFTRRGRVEEFLEFFMFLVIVKAWNHVRSFRLQKLCSTQPESFKTIGRTMNLSSYMGWRFLGAGQGVMFLRGRVRMDSNHAVPKTAHPLAPFPSAWRSLDRLGRRRVLCASFVDALLSASPVRG